METFNEVITVSVRRSSKSCILSCVQLTLGVFSQQRGKTQDNFPADITKLMHDDKRNFPIGKIILTANRDWSDVRSKK
jgi:hypothetical protein